MPLFNYSALGDFVKQEARKISETAGGLDKADVADQAVAVDRLTPRLADSVPTLERTHASFEVEDLPKGVRVRALVPIQGSVHLLNYVPKDAPKRGGLPGSPTGGGYMTSKPAVVLERTFQDAPTADEVKGWAREELDEVDIWLDLMRAELQAAEGSLRDLATQAVAERSAALNVAARLQSELGTGL